MTIQPDKKLIRLSNVLTVLSIFFALWFGLGNIPTLCYELGKDSSDTFIYVFLVEAVKAYATFFIGILTYVLARNVKRGIVFDSTNQRILRAIGLSTAISGFLINAIIHLAPIEMAADTSLLLIFIGVFVSLVSLIFKIGIRMKEEQELTI